MSMKLNPDTKRVAIVKEKLAKNTEVYGKPYCPCLPLKNEDTVCPCKYMRTMDACRCGLYVPANN